MNKYDCSKTVDLIHEYRRLCGTNMGCYSCPIHKPGEYGCHLEDFSDKEIQMIQKWSDEHPEEPKLTRKEYDFLTSFKHHKARSICRHNSGYCYLYVFDEDKIFRLDDSMFSFIECKYSMTFDQLLELEVEDE